MAQNSALVDNSVEGSDKQIHIVYQVTGMQYKHWKTGH